MTFSAIVFHGRSVADWNTIPMSFEGPFRTRPARVTVPCVTVFSPARIFSSVVLPHPDGPTMEISSPCRTVRLMSSRAETGLLFLGLYSLYRPSTAIQLSLRSACSTDGSVTSVSRMISFVWFALLRHVVFGLRDYSSAVKVVGSLQ